MGVVNFFKLFEPAVAVSVEGPALCIFYDASILWINAFSEGQALFDHEYFVNYFFEKGFALEIRNMCRAMSEEEKALYGIDRQKVFIIFDNKSSRKFEKWQECIVRSRLFSIPCPQFKMDELIRLFAEKTAELKLEDDFSFEIIEASFDTDSQIKRRILNIIDQTYANCQTLPSRIYTVITADSETVEFEGGSIVIVTNDSDFCSFFPLSSSVVVMSQHGFADRKEFSKIVNYKIKSGVSELVDEGMLFVEACSGDDARLYDDFCRTIFAFIGMFSVNDYITCDFKDVDAFKFTLQYFRRGFDRAMDVLANGPTDDCWVRCASDLGRLDLRFLFTYIYTWISKSPPGGLRKLFQNALRWFCFETPQKDNSNSFFLFKFNSQLNPSNAQKTQIVLSSLAELSSMVREKTAFLLKYPDKFSDMERNFKTLLSDTPGGAAGVTSINVTNVISELFTKRGNSGESTASAAFTAAASAAKKTKLQFSNDDLVEVCAFLENIYPLVMIFFTQLVYVWSEYVWEEMCPEFALVEQGTIAALEKSFNVTLRNKPQMIENTRIIIKNLIDPKNNS